MKNELIESTRLSGRLRVKDAEEREEMARCLPEEMLLFLRGLRVA